MVVWAEVEGEGMWSDGTLWDYDHYWDAADVGGIWEAEEREQAHFADLAAAARETGRETRSQTGSFETTPTEEARDGGASRGSASKATASKTSKTRESSGVNGRLEAEEEVSARLEAEEEVSAQGGSQEERGLRRSDEEDGASEE